MIEFLSVENAAALLTLTVLEIVLGIDNVVFIAILSGKLPAHQQDRARNVGLMLAMGVRVLLLLSITWVMGLTAPLMELFGHEISGRDLVLLLGGGFLIYKATHEIHDKLEGSHETLHQPKSAQFGSVVTQIVLLDIVFSLDSVITAVGMVKQDPEHPWHAITIMITAIVLAIGVMLLFSGRIARFIERHPTTKVLALSFLLMIGLVLVAEGFHQHIEKGYVYSAMAFSVFVECINLRVKRKNRKAPEAAGG
ncbi:MAG: TerC family protein [Candidatus Hydrogenedens sp.]|nr:TerC family protein [Candidatus Hydrogenedens sp.]